MAVPRPEPGLVISYDYLWRHQREAGLEEGVKTRPCAIVVAVHKTDGAIETVVAPITHRCPSRPQKGIELPAAVKQHLGLDDRRSCVVVTDLNVFLWPGYDLRPVPGRKDGRFHYGYLPPRLFKIVREAIRESLTAATPRDYTTKRPAAITAPAPCPRGRRWCPGGAPARRGRRDP
jgi:hypothetical protein